MGHNPDTIADGRLMLDNIFDILRNRHRRIALGVLKTHERTFTLKNLTNEVATRAHNGHITDIPDEKVNQIHLSLAYIHVPELADEMIIEYDQDRNLIVPTDRLEQLEPPFQWRLTLIQ